MTFWSTNKIVNKRLQIRIQSILGGHSPTTHFARDDQFLASLGIDPSLPTGLGSPEVVASGLLRAVGVYDYTEATKFNHAPLWFKGNPKDGIYYVSDYQGSVYSVSPTTFAVTGLSDGGNEPGTGKGNGQEYYDNYMYFSRNTTIARYGPLNGTPTLNGDYWGTTLAKTSLVNTTYPTDLQTGTINFPNHVLHRHSDGRLYVADVVDNKGTIHYIQTTKTTVEGDTDNGSTYNKLQFGFGLWPTSIESYGSDLAIALYEGNSNNARESRAKLAFWDTLSQNPNKITWVEFPDPYISAMKNINGVLYVVSGGINSAGFRVSRFVGGYTFEEVGSFETGQTCFPGAIEGRGHQVCFGSRTSVPTNAGCVYSLGLSKRALGQGLFNILRATGSNALVTCIGFVRNAGAGLYEVLAAGWNIAGSSGNANNGFDVVTDSSSGTFNSLWWSQVFKIGQPFKILRIRIPVIFQAGDSINITPKLYFDSGLTTKTLTTINGTNYPAMTHIVIRPENAVGNDNFFLELKWNNKKGTVALPITIEYELIDD